MRDANSTAPHHRQRLVLTDGTGIEGFGHRGHGRPMDRAIVLGSTRHTKTVTAFRATFVPRFHPFLKDSTLIVVRHEGEMFLAVRANDAHIDPQVFCSAFHEVQPEKPCRYMFYRHGLETSYSWDIPVERARKTEPEPRRDVFARTPGRREWDRVPDHANRGDSITISIADRRLFYRGANGQVLEFPVAVGRSKSLIILGDTLVVRKRPNPTWRPTPTMRAADPNLPPVVGPGPANPLGKYALDLAWPYIRIHGTNDPDSVGLASSSGCYRMLAQDIERLFSMAGIGTRVRIVPHTLKRDQLADVPEGG